MAVEKGKDHEALAFQLCSLIDDVPDRQATLQ